MDTINNRDNNLFSRGPSPPPQQQSFQVPFAQSNEPNPTSSSPPFPQYQSPTSATAAATAQTHLDSLLHNLSSPQQPQRQPSPQPGPVGGIVYGPQEAPVSAPATPASIHAGSVTSSGSAPSNQTADKKTALLSLLGAVSSPPSSTQNVPLPPAAAPPPRAPTPPGASGSRQVGTTSESQGKFLLEQLMSGSAPKYPEPNPASQPLPTSQGPSPTYYPSLSDPQPHPEGEYYGGDASYITQEHSRDTNVPPASAQPRPPSPTRRSMFDFVSAFDALAGSPSTQVKRKVSPPQAPPVAGGSEDNWTNTAPIDPKRKSVENLMDQLTRGQAPLSAPSMQSTVNVYDPYPPSEETTPHPDTAQSNAPRPLPPRPIPQVTSSPRASPPKPAPQRQQKRAGESPIPAPIQSQYQVQPSRDKEVPSPGYRVADRGRGGAGPRGKRHVFLWDPESSIRPADQTIHSSQPQTIIFDVSQALDEIQAPRDAVKSTAIALVRVDSTFMPGTTIGATHWVAYAMTKGRVRVISRSSGDRTLLQLPQLFPPAVSVSDMSVHSNRLAGITSDGGFVVWELPEVIRDDVPGNIVLCVLPSQELDPLHSVKWHPQQPDLVAVASDSSIYLINISDAANMWQGDPIPQSELARVSHIFSVPSPIIAFDYDLPRSAVAAISEDSSLTMWHMRDTLPFWSSKIRGDDTPSSLTFVEQGVVVGRKNGTVFQLLPIMNRNVLSTIKFVNGNREDTEMFGHANYDSRIQTLWIANNRRDSMIGFKINWDGSTPSPGGDDVRGGFFEQVIEFGGPKPTIHFVILTADADPTGEEAHAACVAAKVPPGELALVAFSVHSGGVDQVLIRKEWYNSAMNSVTAKFPSYVPPPVQINEVRVQRPQPPIIPNTQMSQPPPPPAPPLIAPTRAKTPPSEDVEGFDSNQGEGRAPEPKGRGQKGGRNVGWKDNNDSGRDAKGKGIDTSAATESSLQNLSKEIRKSEESLHTRLGRLFSKELEKQYQRLEDARANEQAADFVRQEKILKLISTELTKNTTRVVEMAVKAEVQNSVLPSLENITKTEIKSSMNQQISKGLSDAMKQNLPAELERLLVRPDVSAHIARTFTSTVTPLVERQVKETITKSLIPAYTQQSSAMHQELSREIHTEILNLKKEVITWQTEALRGQEAVIRELEQSVRMLTEQVKFLSLNATSTSVSSHSLPARSSPAPSTTGNLTQLLRHPNMAPVNQPPNPYPQPHGPYQVQQQQPPQMHGPWFSSSVAAPQASHPVAPPPVPAQQANIMRTPPPPPSQPEEWDDTYLAVLGSQDPRQLRELLARSNPDIIMPLNGSGPLSQAVVLTLVHRLSSLIGETPPVDDSFKSSLWWLQRASSTLNTNDPLISPYVSRVLPNVQSMLNTTKQRLAILPGGPLMDTARTISDIQDLLSRKPL